MNASTPARAAVILILLGLLALPSAARMPPPQPDIPLQSGTYVFQHRYAEQPNMSSFKLNARIKGRHIVLTNPKASEPFPAGVLAEGELFWHAPSSQWIIVTDPEDRQAPEAGGCSDGPETVDLVNKIYWTC